MDATANTDPDMRFTSADLALMPDDGKRYEIVDGELFVSKQPSWHHQFACAQLSRFLQEWSERTGRGVTNQAPGLILTDEDDVAPDVVWISRERLTQALGDDGKLHAAPELIVEVLSPGPFNERRDRQAKLKLYSRVGVQEYWIVDIQKQQAEVYRRQDTRLVLTTTVLRNETIESPLLPGFSLPLAKLLSS